jgi:diadenosine tetraphosphate (Ap4A) HIT family hydrolase
MYEGGGQMVGCRTCELVARRDAGEAPLWDDIRRTPYWDLVHSFDTSLPGWLVLVLRRHEAAVAGLTEEEAIALGVLLRRVSGALQSVVGCEKTYVVQFAEHPDHPHVHFHIIPRLADQPAETRGPRIFDLSGVPPQDRLSEAQMNAVAKGIGQAMLSI